MRRPLTALVLGTFVISCSADKSSNNDGGGNDSGSTLNRTPQANDKYITLEATTIDASNSSAGDWFKNTYLSKLSMAPNVVATRHYAPLGGPPPLPFPGMPTDVTVFHFGDQASQDGFGASSAAKDAASALSGTSGVTQVWRSPYTLTSSADNGNSSGTPSNITIIGLVIDSSMESTIIDWEDNKHVPWVMKYQGIAKVVRYKKASGGTNDGELPKFLEFFYYRDQAAADGQQADQNFMDAEADRMAMWTDSQLAIKPIVATKLAP